MHIHDFFLKQYPFRFEAQSYLYIFGSEININAKRFIDEDSKQ